MYSALSFNQSAKGRTGFAELRHNCGSLGRGCACFLASSYPGDPGFPFAGPLTPALPPWQSTQLRYTVPVECMVGESVMPWHETHPLDCARHVDRHTKSHRPHIASAMTAFLKSKAYIGGNRKQCLPTIN